LVEPGGEGGFVVGVAVGAVVDAGAAVFGDGGVEVFGALVEEGVVGVAESADGVAHAGEGGRAVEQGGVQGLGVVRRFAVAVGAGGGEHVVGGGGVLGGGCGHGEEGGGEAALAGFLGGLFGEALGGAGLGAPEDGERGELGGGRCGTGGGGGTTAAKHAGEEAVEPGALLGGEGGGVGNEGCGRHPSKTFEVGSKKFRRGPQRAQSSDTEVTEGALARQWVGGLGSVFSVSGLCGLCGEKFGYWLKNSWSSLSGWRRVHWTKVSPRARFCSKVSRRRVTVVFTYSARRPRRSARPMLCSSSMPPPTTRW